MDLSFLASYLLARTEMDTEEVREVFDVILNQTARRFIRDRLNPFE